MNDTAIASLITAPEEISPLLEILWEIEQYEAQGHHLIELSDIGLEDFEEVSKKLHKQSLCNQRTMDSLKKANPIAAPMTIRGF
ncbi:hypothetical protein H6F42_21370 [Pseudanabaena sp. FACHB-1998]|uniref:hypothetical protein n=1 Tax=Pseudanabaena sp. FACHB-1998 TaxID=2692858 RepID=UPI0016818FA2|nr:hypothetical protein [Pseudanabaena sp. FACHB-1998]MBD2179466.1 hypothetical protein [Pseudanabaena sp. FACHB-1998]